MSTATASTDSTGSSATDISTLDLLPTGEVNFDVCQSWATTLDFIETAIRPQHAERPVEEVVVRGAFKPKVINGGRDEK